MEHTAIFEEQVPLLPQDLRNEIKNIDSLLEQKVKEKLEGKCSRHGFVVPGSMEILSRSMGMIEKGRFTGSILFHVQAEGKVINPPDGVVVEGEVIRKNKMGIYVNYQVPQTLRATANGVEGGMQDAIRIIVPRDLHIGNDEFETLSLGDTVQVEIKKSRFQVNDEYILSVGMFKKVVSSARVPEVAGVKEVEDAEGEAEEAEAAEEAAEEEAEAAEEAAEEEAEAAEDAEEEEENEEA
jgi:DNA-directed RNA polymerase subunit E'/Rpb7